MAEAYQLSLMNRNKRKVSPNAEETDSRKNKSLVTDNSGSLLSLIETFLTEQLSKGEISIFDIHFRLSWWQQDYLLFKFLELVVKIRFFNAKNSLEDFLEDIEAFGLELLGLPEPPENVYTTIVTKALEVSKDYVLQGDNKDGVVKVEPKPKKGLISEFIGFLVKTLVKFLYPKLKTPYYLTGDFGPIREETNPTSNVKVKGEIPTDLNGMLVRNGPNPPFDPVAKYAWLDGDSMLHAIRFKEGKATYVSRYVQTSRFKQDQFFQESEFLQYGDLEGPFGLLMSCVQLLKAKLGVLDPSYGWLNGDTGLIYHSGMLMALQDFDKPYVVNISQDGDLKTLGINNYNKRLTHSFLPHPKKDPHTGEMFILGASYTPPYAIYNYVSKHGFMSNPLPITVSGPTYMHDLGITKNHIIIMDLPYCYDPEHMVKHDDFIYRLDIEKKSRFGILGKYATSEDDIKWFEFDDCFFIFHNGNSWEEDDGTIVLISCLMKPNIPPPPPHKDNLMMFSSAARSSRVPEVPKKTKLFFSPAHVYSGPSRRTFTRQDSYNQAGGLTFIAEDSYEVAIEPTLPTLYKFTFNMKTGEASKKELSKTFGDFPKINESYIGRKSQYVYISEANTDTKLISIVKTDVLKWNTELKLEFGENKYGSEVAFVPRKSVGPSAEDDGYLTTFVHDEANCVSFAYVIDAQKMELSAMIELPNRVPYGFHATFVTEKELEEQKEI